MLLKYVHAASKTFPLGAKKAVPVSSRSSMMPWPLRFLLMQELQAAWHITPQAADFSEIPHFLTPALDKR